MDYHSSINDYLQNTMKFCHLIIKLNINSSENIINSEEASVADLINSAIVLSSSVVGEKANPITHQTSSYHNYATQLVDHLNKSVNNYVLEDSTNLNIDKMNELSLWYKNFGLAEVEKLYELQIKQEQIKGLKH